MSSEPLWGTQKRIKEVCSSICELLLKKNADYGNSFAHPIGVFSQASAEEQLNVRIDDKLKRIQNQTQGHDPSILEDTELDLIGYLILKRVLRAEMQSPNEC